MRDSALESGGGGIRTHEGPNGPQRFSRLLRDGLRDVTFNDSGSPPSDGAQSRTWSDPPGWYASPVTPRNAALGGAIGLAVVAGVLNYSGASDVVVFIVAALALAGLAWVVSFATEQVGARFGPAITGFLQSTLGNLPELFIVLFALGAGHVVVAQTSVIGSLFANALLVMGVVIVVGARQADDGFMRFRKRLPNDTATLLLVATFIIVTVGLALRSHGNAARHTDEISAVGAVC